MLVFVDFEDSGIDRTEFRRMVKALSKVPIYSHVQGKILYFNIEKQENVVLFLINMKKILNSQGLNTEMFLNTK
jgi:hypothetical protein